MIEAVGQNYLQSYFNTIKKNLSTNGNVGIQAITIDDSLFDRYKNKQDFIQKYIFPGGFLPSKKSLYALSSSKGLAIDKYPELKDEYFKHYKKVVYLAQTRSESLQHDAKKYADFLDLDYSFQYTGLENVESQLNQMIS